MSLTIAEADALIRSIRSARIRGILMRACEDALRDGCVSFQALRTELGLDDESWAMALSVIDEAPAKLGIPRIVAKDITSGRLTISEVSAERLWGLANSFELELDPALLGLQTPITRNERGEPFGARMIQAPPSSRDIEFHKRRGCTIRYDESA
jgi:hypothetical protein